MKVVGVVEEERVLKVLFLNYYLGFIKRASWNLSRGDFPGRLVVCGTSLQGGRWIDLGCPSGAGNIRLRMVSVATPGWKGKARENKYHAGIKSVLESQLHFLLPVWPWVNYLTSQRLYFFLSFFLSFFQSETLFLQLKVICVFASEGYQRGEWHDSCQGLSSWLCTLWILNKCKFLWWCWWRWLFIYGEGYSHHQSQHFILHAIGIPISCLWLHFMSGLRHIRCKHKKL